MKGNTEQGKLWEGNLKGNIHGNNHLRGLHRHGNDERSQVNENNDPFGVNRGKGNQNNHNRGKWSTQIVILDTQGQLMEGKFIEICKQK